jgi:hypothetical protein
MRVLNKLAAAALLVAQGKTVKLKPPKKILHHRIDQKNQPKNSRCILHGYRIIERYIFAHYQTVFSSPTPCAFRRECKMGLDNRV